jgi:hypothetical protein
MDRYAARMREAILRMGFRRAMTVIGGLILTFGLFLPWFMLEWGESFPNVTGLDVYLYGAALGRLLIILTVLIWILILANRPLSAVVAGICLLVMMLYVVLDRRHILGDVLWNRNAFWGAGPYPPLGLGSYVSVTGAIVVIASAFLAWRERKIRTNTNSRTDS